MPGTGRKSVPPFDRLMRRVDKRADGCWQFTGALTSYGYSQFTAENTRIYRDGTRRCRACDRIRRASYRAQKKAEAS